MKESVRWFLEVFGEEGAMPQVFFSPGRINLIGEHIDYNGGLVLPAALSIGMTAVVRFRKDRRLRLVSMQEEQRGDFEFSVDFEFDERLGWLNYPLAVAKVCLQDGLKLCGADILINSNLPKASGLSSSAALEVLIAYVITYPFDDNPDRVRIARICQRAENEVIGVKCGIMDSFVVAMGRDKRAVLLDTHNLSYRFVPISLSEFSLVIMDSHAPRKLSDSNYNKRRNECEQALIEVRKFRKVSNLVSISGNDLRKISDPNIRKRARHVMTEQRRVKDSVKMLKKGDAEGFGKILKESHRSLRDNFEVTGFYLDALVESAWQHPACVGARMTGAGFGGCAIALVRQREIECFKKETAKIYKERTALQAFFYSVRISDGVHLVR